MPTAQSNPLPAELPAQPPVELPAALQKLDWSRSLVGGSYAAWLYTGRAALAPQDIDVFIQCSSREDFHAELARLGAETEPTCGGPGKYAGVHILEVRRAAGDGAGSLPMHFIALRDSPEDQHASTLDVFWATSDLVGSVAFTEGGGGGRRRVFHVPAAAAAGWRQGAFPRSAFGSLERQRKYLGRGLSLAP